MTEGSCSSPDAFVRHTVLVSDKDRIRAAVIEARLREARRENVRLAHEMNGTARRIAGINSDVIVIDLGNPDHARSAGAHPALHAGDADGRDEGGRPG
jgi:AmiR/NasT family two-component response regulator